MSAEFNQDLERLRIEDPETFKEWCTFSWSVIEADNYRTISPAGLVSISILQLVLQDAIKHKGLTFVLTSNRDSKEVWCYDIFYTCSIVDRNGLNIISDVRSNTQYGALLNAYLDVKFKWEQIMP